VVHFNNFSFVDMLHNRSLVESKKNHNNALVRSNNGGFL
jgi:hypothetical protein